MYKYNAKLIYNFHCGGRLDTRNFKSFLRRLDKAIISAKANKDEELAEDLMTMYKAIETVSEKLSKVSERLP